MSEQEDIKTIRHFVYKAGKWNDSAEEYANDTGVYDALDRIETALAARDAGAVTITDTMVERGARALYEANTAMVWDDASGTVRFHWKEDARVALTAALGGTDANG